jgi:hypothetical protein
MKKVYGLIWYSFMSNFTSNFTTSITKQPTLCPILWSASLKTHSHRVKHMVKLPKHGSLPHSWSCSWSCFLKKSFTGEAELCQTALISAKKPEGVYILAGNTTHLYFLFNTDSHVSHILELTGQFICTKWCWPIPARSNFIPYFPPLFTSRSWRLSPGRLRRDPTAISLPRDGTRVLI